MLGKRENDMPQVTVEKLKADFQASPKTVSKMLGNALREFGYTDITDEWVETEIRRLLDGGETKGGPSLFLLGWLKDGID